MTDTVNEESNVAGTGAVAAPEGAKMPPERRKELGDQMKKVARDKASAILTRLSDKPETK